MANIKPATNRSPKIARSKAEHDWQRLCDSYLPVRRRGSIWRFSHKRRSNCPTRGWKLHVSATVLSACDIFRLVGPYLRRRKVMFKGPKTLAELYKLNAGIFYGFSQVGKFITIYPESTESAVALARELDRLIRNQPAPIIPCDSQLRRGSCIFYRYGGFSNATVVFRRKRVPAITGPDGKRIPDRREPGAAIPKWLTDPFQRARSRTALEFATPLETDYTDYEAILQRGRGGNYYARDISSARAKRVVIKEGRRHGETDPLGRDGVSRIKREEQVLRSVCLAAAPRLIRTFRANGCYHLVMERIVGRPLQQVIASRERISTRRLLGYCAEMARIVADIHAAGWAWRDCKPGNFLLEKSDKMRALDFEGACRLHKADPPWLQTPGYAPPKRHKNNSDPMREDLYALGTSMIQLIARSKSPTRCGAAFYREIKRRGLPRQLAKKIGHLRSLDVETRTSAGAIQHVVEELLRSST